MMTMSVWRMLEILFSWSGLAAAITGWAISIYGYLGFGSEGILIPLVVSTAASLFAPAIALSLRAFQHAPPVPDIFGGGALTPRRDSPVAAIALLAALALIGAIGVYATFS